MRETITVQERGRFGMSLRKFVVLNLAVATATCGFAISLPAGPKRPAKSKAAEKTAEKVARTTDDTKVAARELPKQVAENHPLKPVINQAEASLAVVAALKDYSTILYKKEMVQSKLISQTLTTKIRHQPFSVYMHFDDMHAGREVIYVEGANKGKLLVHESGLKALAGTITLLPNSKDAMAENRYPITQAGMAKMLEVAIALWQADAQYQEVQVQEFPGVKVGDKPCVLLETIHPQPRDHFKFYKTRLFIEHESKFPIRLEQYTWPEKEGGEPILVEEYTFTQIKPNLGLTDIDFDKSNKAYKF